MAAEKAVETKHPPETVEADSRCPRILGLGLQVVDTRRESSIIEKGCSSP